MRTLILVTVLLLSPGFTHSSGRAAQEPEPSVDRLSREIIGLERSALDRWITFDPQGYLDLYAPEATYFDPNQERRADGLEAMKTLLEPVRKLKGTIKDRRYENDCTQSPTPWRHSAVDVESHQLRETG